MFKWITAGAVAGMIAVGTFFVVDIPVSAQTDDSQPAQEQVERQRGERRGNHGPGRMQDRSEHQAAVAEILGLTVEDLQAAHDAGQTMDEIVEAQGLTMEAFHAAMQTAKIAQVNQAVADGELTQERADAMIERIENGEIGRRGKGHGRGHGSKHRGAQLDSDRGAVVAEILGMTVEELQAARDAGQTKDELLEAQGLTMEEFRAAMQAAKIAQINQAVIDGELTQEQADAMIERIENGNDGRDRGGRGGPDRDGEGRGGPGRGGPGGGQRG